MTLSQDDAKVIVNLLEQLNYKLKDARVVNMIIDKLNLFITQPDLKPAVKPQTVTTELVTA